MFRYIPLAALIFTFLIGPTQTHAYLTTGQQAFTVNGETAVFLIDFTFGHGKYDLELPLRAQRSSSAASTSTLQFDVLNADNEPGKGTALGIVLGDTRHTSSLYTIPRGKKENLRLLVLYTRTPDEDGMSFRTQVTELPFSFKGVQSLQLNPSELTHYVTNPLPLKKGLGIETTSKN
jgi:hypothetical protein